MDRLQFRMSECGLPVAFVPGQGHLIHHQPIPQNLDRSWARKNTAFPVKPTFPYVPACHVFVSSPRFACPLADSTPVDHASQALNRLDDQYQRANPARAHSYFYGFSAGQIRVAPLAWMRHFQPLPMPAFSQPMLLPPWSRLHLLTVDPGSTLNISSMTRPPRDFHRLF